MEFLNRRWRLSAYKANYTKGWVYWELQIGFLVFQYKVRDFHPHYALVIWQDKIHYK